MLVGLNQLEELCSLLESNQIPKSKTVVASLLTLMNKDTDISYKKYRFIVA